MNNPKQIWKIVNSLYAIPLIIYVFTTLHWPIFYRFTLVEIIIIVAVIYALKSWVEIKFKVGNLIKQNTLTKALYYIGGGFLFIGILFKVMHWPGANISLLLGTLLIILSFIIIFFVDETNQKKQSNPDILDDI